MKKKETKKNSEYVTMSVFEKAMASIAKSFTRINERFERIDGKFDRHENILNTILKQLQSFIEEGKEHRKSLSTLMRTDIGREKDIEDLKVRVDCLETQIK